MNYIVTRFIQIYLQHGSDATESLSRDTHRKQNIVNHPKQEEGSKIAVSSSDKQKKDRKKGSKEEGGSINS